MARKSKQDVGRMIASLLTELSAGGVHCVVLIGAVTENKPTFGIEYNTKRDVALGLLHAGLQKLDQVGLLN